VKTDEQTHPPIAPSKAGPHPVLVHGLKFAARVETLKLTCLDEIWRGWEAKHRFRCAEGHEIMVSPVSLLGGLKACPACRAEACMRRLHASAAAANVACLDTVWRGANVAYRLRCGAGHEWTHTLKNLTGCPVCNKETAKARRRLQDGLQRLTRLALERGGACLSEVYLGQAVRHRFRCAEGHEWETTASEVLRGAWCRRCAYADKAVNYRLPDGLARLRQAAQDKGGLCLSDAYMGSKHTYRFRCGKGHEWQTLGALVLRGAWCLACVDERKGERLLLADGFARLLQMAADKGGLCLSDAYLGGKRHYRFRCERGHEWDANAASIFRGGWCSICAHAARRLGIEAARATAQARGGQCLSQSYVGTSVKMEWMCDRGHTWHARFGKIRRGQWCPQCAHMARISNKNSTARRRYEAAGQLP